MTALLSCKLAMPGENWSWQECLPFAKFPWTTKSQMSSSRIMCTNSFNKITELCAYFDQTRFRFSTYPHSKSCKFHLSSTFPLAGLGGNISTPRPNNQFLPCLSMFRKGCWRSSPSTTRAAPVWCLNRLNSKMDPDSPRFNDLQTTSSDFMLAFFGSWEATSWEKMVSFSCPLPIVFNIIYYKYKKCM